MINKKAQRLFFFIEFDIRNFKNDIRNDDDDSRDRNTNNVRINKINTTIEKIMNDYHSIALNLVFLITYMK